MTIIRGLPGSGKSTLAARLSKEMNAVHVEADMFHMKSGVYDFKVENQAAGHNWCKTTVRSVLEDGGSVIVSNTFTQKWELDPYFSLAKRFGIIPVVIVCKGDYGSIHNVPEDTIMRMRNRFQHDITDLYTQHGIV